MKYLKVIADETGGQGSYGILQDGKVHLLDASPLSGGAKKVGVSFPVEKVKEFLPPVDPPNIVALGLNYEQHAKESKKEIPSSPIIFLKATSALTGHLQPIILPKEAPSEVDYEAELAVVIGRPAKNIKPEQVFEYIFGYTCANDVSARDCQLRRDKQWARAKSFDTFCPVGPVIETQLDPSNLKVCSKLNGKLMQEGRTSDLIFNVPEIVSYLSRQMTLLAGTLILTGTPSGVGFARKPAVFLKPGDKIQVKVEDIGTLENPVMEEK